MARAAWATRQDVPAGRIPVTVLTGALGAGKTTILRHLVSGPGMEGVALLINEFGSIGVDHHLVGSVDETTMLLDSGCICCTIQGGLMQALLSLFERSARGDIAPLRRVLIETTGLADPVPVVQTLMQAPLVAARFLCDGVVTVVDATQDTADLETWPETLAQVVAADRLLLSKADLASSVQHSAMLLCLARLNPGVAVFPVRHGEVSAHAVFGTGTYALESQATAMLAGTTLAQTKPMAEAIATKPAKHSAFHGLLQGSAGAGNRLALPNLPERSPGAVHHRAGVGALAVTFDAPVSWASFAVAIGGLLQDFGANMLRIKGLLNVAGESGPVVVQCVRGVAFPALKLERWPDLVQEAGGGGQLVFIVQNRSDNTDTTIRTALARQPSRQQAWRACLGTPDLPTRSWLRQRIAPYAPEAESEAWSVHARRFTVAGASVATL